jgi:hypothetical protein
MLGIHRSPAIRSSRRAARALANNPPPRHRRRRACKVECLEERTLLSTWHVTSLADSGDGTLRWAITQANSQAGDDLIDFGVTGTITLASASPDFNDTSGKTDVEGPGASSLTVARSSDMETPAFRIFTVNAGATVSLSGMTITGGQADQGGAIRNQGDLTISGCTISSNTARTGGGIYNLSDLTLSNVIVQDNLAQGIDGANDIGQAGGDAQGGGIYSGAGMLSLTNSQVAGNQARGGNGGAGNSSYPPGPGGGGGNGRGGGLYIDGGMLSISDSTLQANTVTGGIGGSGGSFMEGFMAFGADGGPGGNAYGGGLYSAIDAVITHSTFEADGATGGTGGGGGYGNGYAGYGGSGYGGGIYANCDSFTMTDSHFNANTATGGDGGGGGFGDWGGSGGSGGSGRGGGLYMGGRSFSITNSTLGANAATGGAGGGPGGGGPPNGVGGRGGDSSGGGLYSSSDTVTITKSTLGDNTATGGPAGPIYFSFGGTSDAGDGVGDGGGIYNDAGTMTITASTIIDSSAVAGGGIYSLGDLTLSNVVVKDNRAQGRNGPDGGLINGRGIDGQDAQGGGVYSGGGLLSLTNTQVTGNEARGGNGGPGVVSDVTGGSGGSGQGGGLYIGAGTLEILDSTLGTNTATGGNGGTQPSAGAAGKGQGGGLYSGGAATSITNSTLAGNTATGGAGEEGDGVVDGGGGLWNSSKTTLTNSTVYGNTAAYGGAIQNYAGTLLLTNVTITGNRATTDTGGGITSLPAGIVTLNNTIVAGNLAGATGSTPGDFKGAADSASAFNLIGDGDDLTGISNGSQGNQIGTGANPIDPHLGPLGAYGGPTETVEVLANSPAVATGSTALAVDPITKTPLQFDQRGPGFPRTTDGTVDIGAFEAPFVVTTLQVSAASGTYGGAVTLHATLLVGSQPQAGQTVEFHLGTNDVGAALTDAQGVATLPDVSLGSTGAGTHDAFISVEFAGGGSLRAATGSATLTVSPAALTVTADNLSKVYGAAVPTLTYTITGFVNGDGPSAVSGTPALTTTATAASGVAGNPYAIDVAIGTLAAANYRFPNLVPGALAVTPAPLTVTADNLSKVYGAAVPTLTYAITGFVAGDGPSVVSGTPALTTTATAASGVAGSPYAIDVAIGTLAAANYRFPNLVHGALAVTPAPLTVTADSKTMAYGAKVPTLTYKLTGLVNGDTLSVVSGSPALTTTATSQSHVAGNPYPINVAQGTLSAANYTFTTFAAGSLKITPAALAINANDASIIVGQPLPSFTATYSGFRNGDGPASLDAPVIFSTNATQSSPVGKYIITPRGASDPDYKITFQTGILTVEQFGLRPDPHHAGLSIIMVGGSPGSSIMQFRRRGGPGGQVMAILNGNVVGSFPVGKLSAIVAFGGSGDNRVRVMPAITLPTVLFAGAGNSVLRGGRGNNVLVGGPGNAVLIGGPRRDLLIGGPAKTTMIGNGRGDILIAGTASFDRNLEALDAIMAEWASSRSYADRVANLSGTDTGPVFALRKNGNIFLRTGGPNPTVFEKSLRNVIPRISRNDWVFRPIST